MFSKSTVKYIQSLHHKKFRDQFNAFMAEGPKVVTELLEADIFTCSNIYGTKEWAQGLSTSLMKRCENRLEIIQDFELEKISALVKANGVLAVFDQRKAAPVSPKQKLTLVLDDIQDPGNLGTIIRIADWYGIKAIYCSMQTADMYNPKVVQSTMASLARVQIFYTNISELLAKNDIKKYAATLEGKPLDAVGKISEGMIIIGNESKGISKEILELADEKITIPRIGLAESLNAGVATGIILYAVS